MKLLFAAIDGMGVDNARFLGKKLNLPTGLLESLPNNMNISGPAWTSIYTGVPPEDHGIVSIWGYSLEKAKTIHGRYTEKSEGYDTLKFPCIWDYLNVGGISCGLYGIPITYPVRQNNRWAIAGFCRSLLSPDSDLYFIENFIDELKTIEMDVTETFVRLAGGANAKEWAKINKNVKDLNELMAIVEDNYTKRFFLLEKVIDKFPVDCLFISIEVFDRIGHLGYNTQKTEPLQFTYKWLEYFINTYNPESVVCVADHGFSDRTHGHDYKGGIISNIGLPNSVLGVKDCILSKFNIDKSATIAPLNNCNVETDAEQVKVILQSLGYI